ncbi:MAG: hypothetical protein VYA01_06530, partial [Bacteroidota bacterium]|nr:hypothetical protein [Bacteroidota bacterium]
MLSNGAAKSVSSTGFSDGSGVGRIGYTDRYFPGYLDESRVSYSVDQPQIKWTHTQTAGAGNKDAYDVHGWRAHGHEFTDDNATSLLIHGGLAESNTTYFDAKGYQFDGTNDNIDYGGSLHGDLLYVTFAGWYFCGKHVQNGSLFSKRSSTEQTGDYFARLQSSGKVEFDVWTGSAWQSGGTAVLSTVPVPIGRVFHFALQFSTDGTGLCKMFLDGDLILKDESISTPTTLNGGTSDFRLCGTDGQNPGVYQGACSGFAFWTHSSESDMLTTLTEANIKALYELGPTGNILTDFSSDLSGWWAMGNQDSLATGNSGGSPAAADTSTTVYDRSRASSTTNGTYNGGTAPVV